MEAAALKPLGMAIRSIFQFYAIGAMAYGLWTFLFLGLREACIISFCEPLPRLNSTILNVLLTLLPDQTVFAVLIGIGRGLAWLPNLLLSLFTPRLSFFDWLFLRDAMEMGSFYQLLDRFLP